LVLFGMQNRTFGPYLAANDRILISLMNAVMVPRNMRLQSLGRFMQLGSTWAHVSVCLATPFHPVFPCACDLIQEAEPHPSWGMKKTAESAAQQRRQAWMRWRGQQSQSSRSVGRSVIQSVSQSASQSVGRWVGRLVVRSVSRSIGQAAQPSLRQLARQAWTAKFDHGG
jgi:hypothetical protein